VVDWNAVEKLRAKGWDWDRIANDPKVGYKADAGIDEPGQALKALYYQRRSKAQRRPTKNAKGEVMETPDQREHRWTLERVGIILTPIFGFWFLFAYVYPSPIGVLVPALPWLGLLLAASAFVLAFGLLRARQRWNKVLRNTMIAGVVAGLAIAGTFGVVGLAQHCPTLTPLTTSEPSPPGYGSSNSYWIKANNPAWSVNGVPVLFFYGSAGCPYCAGSSWAFEYGLPHFGTLSGTTFGYSSPSEAPPLNSIPATYLYGSSLQSTYVAWTVNEDPVSTSVNFPPAADCTQSAYLAAYDAVTAIPFIVVGGTYIHYGSLVSPAQLSGLTTADVQSQMAAQSGTAWNEVSPAMYYLMAYMVKVNNGQPTSIAQIPQVAAALALIS